MKPRTFLDAKGIERTLNTTPEALADAQAATGLNLSDMLNGLVDVSTNPTPLVTMLMMLSLPADMPAEDAFEAFTEDTVTAALDALVLALIDQLPEESRGAVADAWAASAAA